MQGQTEKWHILDFFNRLRLSTAKYQRTPSRRLCHSATEARLFRSPIIIIIIIIENRDAIGMPKRCKLILRHWKGEGIEFKLLLPPSLHPSIRTRPGINAWKGLKMFNNFLIPCRSRPLNASNPLSFSSPNIDHRRPSVQLSTSRGAYLSPQVPFPLSPILQSVWPSLSISSIPNHYHDSLSSSSVPCPPPAITYHLVYSSCDDDDDCTQDKHLLGTNWNRIQATLLTGQKRSIANSFPNNDLVRRCSCWGARA